MLTSFFFLNKKIKIKKIILELYLSQNVREKNKRTIHADLLPVLLYTKYDKTNIRPFRLSAGESQHSSTYNDNK